MKVIHSLSFKTNNLVLLRKPISKYLMGAGVFVLFGFSIILPTLVGILFGSHVSALTYQDEVDLQFTWSPTVNINLSGDLIIANLSPGSSSDSNIITVTAGSNDSHGYTLYSTVGSTTTGYTDLRLDPSNNTNIFTSLSSNKATLSNFDNNTWGYSYCDYTSNANACDTTSNWVSGNTGSTSVGYNGLPLYSVADNSKVKLADTTSADQTTLKFKIGAKAAATQVAGTYTNIVNFIGVGKVITTSYTLNYNGNSATSGTPSSQSGSTTDGVITLSTTTPIKTDYIFKGWCDTDNSSDPTTCSGNTYEPGRIYIIPAASQGSNNLAVNLYAVWESTLSPTMQQFAANNTCATMSAGDTMTLLDSRGNNEYTVAKLADGKCWMTTNLNLAGGTALSADDTDVDASYISSFTTSNNLTKTGDAIVLPSSSQSGFNANNYSYVYNSSSTDCTSATGCYGYYSWDVATLGSGRGISTDDTDAPYSICPKGWRLPTSGSDSSNGWKRGDFYALAAAYGVDLSSSNSNNSATFYNNAGPGTTPNFLLGGRYYSGSHRDGGSFGSYWSSTSYSATAAAYDLFFSPEFVYAPNLDARYDGYSVRCVVEPKYYMQDMTSSTLASLMPNTGDSATLTDKRDGKDYTVAKLADGKYWMTTNLNLAGGTALSADDTDVDASYISSFTTSNNLTKTGNTIVLPASSQSGFNTNNYSYVYNSTSTDCSSSTGCYGYYSWDAATLGSGRSISTDNQNAPYSICPKGWKLPTTYNGSGTAAEATDFRALMIAFGGSNSVQTYSSSTTPTGATMYGLIGPGTTPNFLLAGFHGNKGSVGNGGSSGCYWSATSDSSTTTAHFLPFNSSNVYSASSGNRFAGYSVRCLVAD